MRGAFPSGSRIRSCEHARQPQVAAQALQTRNGRAQDGSFDDLAEPRPMLDLLCEGTVLNLRSLPGLAGQGGTETNWNTVGHHSNCSKVLHASSNAAAVVGVGFRRCE